MANEPITTIVGNLIANPSCASPRQGGGNTVPGVRAAGRPLQSCPGGLRSGERLICGRCVEEAAEGTTTDDADTSVLSADDPVDAYRLTDVELTSEQEYTEALDNEIRWDLEPLEPDGTLTRATDDPTGGRAWGRP